MIKKSFYISGRRPGVIITHCEGSLTIQPWDRKEIAVTAAGPIADLHQEGERVIITDCKGDLELQVPLLVHKSYSITTAIKALDVSSHVTIEGVGEVILKDIRSSVHIHNVFGNIEGENIKEYLQATRVAGNLIAAKVPKLIVQQGITGNASLNSVQQIVIDRIGGDCSVVGASDAEVHLEVINGNVHVTEAAFVDSCQINGNLYLQTHFPAGRSTHFLVTGNTAIHLLDHANVRVRGRARGLITTQASMGDMGMGISSVDQVYGDGSAQLEVSVGGNLELHSTTLPRNNTGAGT